MQLYEKAFLSRCGRLVVWAAKLTMTRHMGGLTRVVTGVLFWGDPYQLTNYKLHTGMYDKGHVLGVGGNFRVSVARVFASTLLDRLSSWRHKVYSTIVSPGEHWAAGATVSVMEPIVRLTSDLRRGIARKKFVYRQYITSSILPST